MRETAWGASALVLLLTLTACAGSAARPASTTAGPADSASGSSSGPANASQIIDAERCAANRNAGTITYLTGYQYQASVTILEPVAAEALGLFDDVCLDVQLQPGTGDVAQNTQLTAAGRAQLAGAATPQKS